MMNANQMLRYHFQFQVLPEAAFENHPELIRELDSPSPFGCLLHFWAKATIRTQGLAAVVLAEGETKREQAELREKNMRGMSIRAHRREGYTVHVVTMPAPEDPPEAYFTAIVHKDGEPRKFPVPSPSTRYMTLEYSGKGHQPMFCECAQDGTHLNSGRGLPPEETAFVDAVFARLR